VNNHIQTMRPICLREFDLQAQFEACLRWNDPLQWEALAVLYFERGYFLNALECFRRADAIRTSRAMKLETMP
jgi:hypothetical protein